MKLPLRNLFISSLSTSALLAGTAAVYVNDGGGDDDDKEDDDGIHKTPSIKNKCSEKRKLKKAEKECKDFIEKMRERNAIPGLVVGVSLKGKDIWVKGFGYSDLESGTKCKPDTVMRIASISKSITMILVAKLIEEGKLDLDASIHKYLTEDQFPKKKWEGNSVDITLRQLVSHLGGIRHYKKDDNKLNQIKPDEHGGGEFAASEYYIREKFASVFDSLKLFKDDELIAKPGSKHLYTTHGFTLISAIVESVLPKKEQFGTYLIENICHKDLGMKDTCLDEYEPIIYNRSKNYIKINGKLCNAPYVENSYKWAGGGLLSTVPDLLKFGKIMLYSFKGGNSNKTLSGMQSSCNSIIIALIVASHG